MTGLQLIATGGALPARAVPNAEFSTRYHLDTSDEWITTRTGIHQRYFCAEGESALTLATAAAAQALERSGIDPAQLGCVVVGTVSGETVTPSLACLVQAALDLPQDIPVLDINAACTGFLYAAQTARGLLFDTPERPYALVIGCEQLSRLIDFTDRSTCVLFGDGAGAGVFQLTDTALYAAMLGARGDSAITVGGPGPEPSYIQMDGKAVFRFAVDALPKCMTGVLQKAGKTLADVDWVVCHQANERIIDHCVKKLAAPPEKFYKNMARYGNTSAASIPIALNEMAEQGLLKPGQTVLCVGFGGGLTWAGTLFTYKGEPHEIAE